MARPESLVPGNCYFRVHFHDDDLLFPYVETLRYVRCDTSDEGPLWLFHTWLLTDDDVDGVPESEGSPGEIFGGVVAKLQEISACHPLLPPPLRTSERATVAPADLDEKVREFLADDDLISLTITIRFADAGFSLSRREGRLGIAFFTHPHSAADPEPPIRALFAGMGVSPSTDNLIDRGRTRILAYPMPDDPTAVIGLCTAVLTGVYGLRADDALDYHPLRRSELQT
jgi:hypothetical protein